MQGWTGIILLEADLWRNIAGLPNGSKLLGARILCSWGWLFLFLLFFTTNFITNIGLLFNFAKDKINSFLRIWKNWICIDTVDEAEIGLSFKIKVLIEFCEVSTCKFQIQVCSFQTSIYNFDKSLNIIWMGMIRILYFFDYLTTTISFFTSFYQSKNWYTSLLLFCQSQILLN